MDVNKIPVSPYGVQSAAARIVPRPRQWESFDAPEPKAVSVQRPADNIDGEVLSPAEKSFFEQMFPAATDEIRSYHSYQRSGAQPTMNIGTMIDRKG
jgi:hypothetical protein